ncbi:GM16641 [Drosophila sechellia]|uniref:GM16641 n=1 Tax=Drosophila sechellia TaxID=7238 RepID=B4ID21_DROSE|nr:GM16641 [Drosophila sechellia]
MLKTRRILLGISRSYTAKTKRSVLAQDKSKIKEYSPKTTDSHEHRVYVWGFQETGALGLQTNVKKAKERYTEMVHHPTRLQFSNNNEITDVAAGYGFTVYAVNRDDGETLFGSGLNTDSQLGFQVKGNPNDPANLDVIIYPTAIKLPRVQGETDEDMRVKSMSAGRAHLVVLTQNGTIFTLGNNSYGQCGRSIIEEERYSKSALIHRISQEDICGKEDEVVQVECGQDHSMFLTKKGRIYTCGWGADGQTGQGNYHTAGQITLIGGDVEKEKIVRLSCSSDCVLALNEAGDAFGWGNSEYGQLDDSELAETQINIPRALKLTKSIGKIKDVAAGGSFCMALNDQGLVYTWGFGILGFGPFQRNNSGFPSGCGVFHMGAVNSDGDLFMWGKNRFGHLGLGHKKDQFFPFKAAINGKVTKVAYGVDHTIALCKTFF